MTFDHIFHQIMAQLQQNLTENVRFSKRSKILFFEKVDWFFRKKKHEFFKLAKGGWFGLDCVCNDIIS